MSRKVKAERITYSTTGNKAEMVVHEFLILSGSYDRGCNSSLNSVPLSVTREE